MISIHFISILFAAIAAFVIGFLFHVPPLGKVWMRLSHIQPTGNEKFSDMYGQMISNFVVNLVTASVLGIMYLFAANSGLLGRVAVINGMIVGFLVWLGFLVTSSSIEVIWMGKSRALWLYEAASSLVVMLAMGAIIAA